VEIPSYHSLPTLLCVANDAKRCTVLYAPARILELGLAIDVAANLLRNGLQVYLTGSVAECQSRVVASLWSWREGERTNGVFPIAPTKPSTERVVKPLEKAFVLSPDSIVGRQKW
jgi:hypothetical protein